MVYSPNSLRSRCTFRGIGTLVGCLLSVGLFACGDLGITTAVAGSWVGDVQVAASPQVTLGLAGHVKLGTWTPISVTPAEGMDSDYDQVAVLLADTDGVPTRTDLVLQDGQFTAAVKLGRRDSTLEIQFRSSSTPENRPLVWRSPVSDLATVVPSTTRWYLQLGPDFDAESIVRRASSSDAATLFTQLDDSRLLPEEWFLLEGVDQLLWATSDAVEDFDLTESQLAAIDLWLRMGGHLTLSVAKAADRLIGPDQPLERFSPGRFDETLIQRQTTELESLLGSVSRLDRAEAEPLQIAILKETQGVVMIQERSGDQRRPLWVRHVRGFGLIDFVAFDLDQEPIASWDGRTPLLTRLLADGRLDSGTRASTTTGRGVAHVGYDDLSGQLRRALDQYPGVFSISFLIIGLILVAYIALIGPGDYFFLKRFAPRMEWTWVTFPLIVLVSAIGIWQLAGWSKGEGTRVNQVDLIDVDLGSGLVRGTTWAHLFSPDTGRYNIGLRLDRVPGEEGGALLSWQGLPGGSLGGMTSRQGLSAVGSPYLVQWNQANGQTNTNLANLPIQIWSTKSLTSRTWSQLDEETLAQPLTEGESQLIHGTVENPTDHDLSECYLFHGRWAYYIPRIPAGGQYSLPPGASAQNTEKLLRKRRITDSADVAEQWDNQGTNVNRIMQIATLHEAAGGKSYTGLTQRYQSFVDLSNLSATGRAILIGTSTDRATTLTLDGTPVTDEATNHWTFVRLVLPVEPAGN
ncbi:MAG: hypothetical protein WD045_07295 [Pirellulaceae bacterium]